MTRITMRTGFSSVFPALFAGFLLLFSGPCMAQRDTAVYWSVSKDGQPRGYLLGTIHSEDPRVLDFPDQFIRELSSNDVYAMEMVPDLPTLSRLTEYMHFQDGTRLEMLIGPDRFQRFVDAVAGYKVPADWVARMKVWAAMITLSVPPPSSGLFMDFSLSLRAAGSGMKVKGLETLEEQLSFLETMPMDMQIGLLDQALEEHQNVERIHGEMVDHYLRNDLQALVRVTEQQMAEVDPDVRDYFMQQGIEARNLRMASSLATLLEQSTVFAAVGALHLPGDTGLINQLRQRGYQLDPLPLPVANVETRASTRQAGQ